MIVFFRRSDLDGKTSAAIVKKKYPDCRLVGVSHGKAGEMFFDKNPSGSNITFKNNAGVIEMIHPGESVFVVDYAFSEVEMVALDLFGNLVWIDHHKSSIEKFVQYNFDGLCEIGQAGCELTWKYLFPDIEMPEPVRLLGAYDTWRFHGHEKEDDYKEVLPFQYGLRTYKDTSPKSYVWDILLKESRESIQLQGELCEIGKVIVDYENQANAKIAKSMAFECEFHGYRAIAMNRSWIGSNAFDAVYDPDLHDIMVLFSTKGDGSFKHSLFCDKPGIDVGALASTYPGGGGHAGAAGFTTDAIQVPSIKDFSKKVA